MGAKRKNNKQFSFDDDAVPDEIHDLINSKRYDEALSAINKILKEQPNNIELWDFKSLSLLALVRHDEALRICDKIMELDPTYTRVWVNKSHILFAMRLYEESLNAVNYAIECGHYYLETQTLKTELLATLERYDEALVISKQRLKNDPDNIKAQELHADILSMLDKHAESAKHLEVVSNANPADIQKILALAVEYLLAKNFPKALEVVDRAMDIAPTSPTIWTLKAEILFGLGRSDDALNYTVISQTMDATFDETWYQKARILAKTDSDGSIDALRTSISINPYNAERAQTETLFLPFRAKNEFRELVGLKKRTRR